MSVKQAFMLIIAVAMLAALLVGCSGPSGKEATGDKAELQAPSSLVTEQSSSADKTREYEVMLTEEGFFPSAFAVAAGERLDLVFLLDEPHFISIEGLGVAELVQQGVVSALVEEPGTYYLLCLDCEEAHEAVIKAD